MTLFSKADKATIGFIVEPGEYRPESVLFINGFRELFLINCYAQYVWLGH